MLVFSYLPREVDPLVYNMSHEDPGNISFSEVGGLSEQIRELREVRKVTSERNISIIDETGGGIAIDQSGIISTRWYHSTQRLSSFWSTRYLNFIHLTVWLISGIVGTGKTLLARAVASQLDCNFLKVVSSAIVDKYIGESARMIREMFAYAKDHQPCIIFMDEIDAIGNLIISVIIDLNICSFK